MAELFDTSSLDNEPLDPNLPGPFPVGRYARDLRTFLRQRAKVLVMGEITGFRKARKAAYFELRDAEGRSRARCGSRTSTGSGSTTRCWSTARGS